MLEEQSTKVHVRRKKDEDEVNKWGKVNGRKWNKNEQRRAYTVCFRRDIDIDQSYIVFQGCETAFHAGSDPEF